jgi:Tat protein translocase TatB subunit
VPSIGPMELVIVLVVALVVLGPSKLPDAARQVGRALAELRRWSTGLQEEVKRAVDVDGR